jgi:hypothetical protein
MVQPSQEQCDEVPAQLLSERSAEQDVLPLPGSPLQEGQAQMADHQRDADC